MINNSKFAINQKIFHIVQERSGWNAYPLTSMKTFFSYYILNKLGIVTFNQQLKFRQHYSQI